MGILHGTIEGIPAFRWVDRPTGKVYVANRPADAAAIEATHSNGRGLLADDGVSVSNLFTGDAPTAYATMSAIGRAQRDPRVAPRDLGVPQPAGRVRPQHVPGAQRDRARAVPGLARAVAATSGRGCTAAGRSHCERAALTGVIRDLNTTLVADAMLKGRRSDLRRLRRLRRGRPPRRHPAARVARRARRHRRGARPARDGRRRRAAEVPHRRPLRPRSVPGRDLRRPVRRGPAARRRPPLRPAAIARSRTPRAAAPLELHARRQRRPRTPSMGRALDRASDRITADTVRDPRAARADAGGAVPRLRVRQPRARLRRRRAAPADRRRARPTASPRSFPGLVAHPGVGFVVVDTAEHGPVALGAGGRAPRPGRGRGRRSTPGAVRPARAGVRAARGDHARGAGHLRQQPARRPRRGGGVRGPRRLPRRARWLAGPRA